MTRERRIAEGFDRAMAAIAILKIAIGLGVLAWTILFTTKAPAAKHWLQGANVLAFGAGGTFLLASGWRDGRIRALGLAFVATASLFAGVQLRLLDPVSNAAVAFALVFLPQVDAFTAWYAWRLAALYPSEEAGHEASRFVRPFLAAAFVVGALLFLVNLGGLSDKASPLWIVSRHNQKGTGYFLPIYGLCAAALVHLAFRARHVLRGTSASQWRRATAVGAIVGGGAPAVLWTVGILLSPKFAETFPFERNALFIYSSLVACVVATLYAAIILRAFDIQLVLRRALQYALAKSSLIVAAGLPLLLLASYAARHAEQTVSDVFVPSRAFASLGISTALLMLLGVRRGLLDRLDRTFFREQYDADQLMQRFAEACRWAESDVELAGLVHRTLTGALHPRPVELLLLDAGGTAFVSPTGHVRPLAYESSIAELVRRADRYVELDLANPTTPPPELTPDSRVWLVDSGARFLVPLRDVTDHLVGVLLLGDRVGDLPYGRRDWDLIGSIVSASEMALSFHTMASRPSLVRAAATVPAVDDAHAMECADCGIVDASGTAACPRCDGSMHLAPLPLVVAGKHRIERRIGRGGMGVVYLARDRDLNRMIAIKTLPAVSPAGAVRLRREAEAMAQVAHPHIATVYGSESWQGQPMLLVEYLPGRTLADRLRAGPMSCSEAIDLGVAIAGALEVLHAAKLLHRDIKPSNLGFTQHDVPKLLDFGLARMIDRSHGTAEPAGAEGTDASTVGLRGTLLYMSPERVAGEPPSPAVDVWSLTVMLYEAMAGEHPFRGASLDETRRRILRCEAADIGTFVTTADDRLAAFFRRGLSKRAGDRPASAGALMRELVALQ